MAKTSSLRPLAWAAALAAAVAVLVPLAITPGAHVVSPPTFLAKLLGPTDTSAPLVRRPADGVRVEITAGGYTVTQDGASVGLASNGPDVSGWHRFAGGVSRQTPFGRETIVVGPDKAEEFLTVTKRQGGKTWRWRLETGELTPRLGDDGAVAFLHGHRLTDTFIAPVAIYDADGKDVTPGGLRWSLEGARSSWWLQLRLNDSKLPLPYVIDPAVVFRSASSGVNTLGLTITLPAPAGVADRDVLVAQITGRYTAGPGTPAGWQLVRTNNMGSGAQAITQSVFVRVAGASEPATYTWTWPTNVRGSGGIGAYAGVDTTAAVNVSSGAGGTGALVTAPSVTTTADNAMLVGFFGMNFPGGTTFLPPAGMTERWDIAGEGVTSEGADAPQPLAGASGAKTATAVGTEEWVAQLVALNVDATGPTFPALSLAENPADPDQHVSGTTLFYRPGGGGSFTITASPSETQSVVRDVAFPAIATVGGGGIADAAPPYDQTYTWDALTSASGAQNVTAANTAGATSTQIFSLAPDSSPPSGGSISYPDGLDADGVVTIATADGSDAGAGINAASGVLERQTAALSGGTCGTFDAWSAVTSPDTVPSGNCAKYRYRVSDNVGNEAVYTSPSVVQVAGGDATPPTAPALVLSEAEPDEHVVGTTVYYNPSGTNAGSFTVGAASSDAESGITRVDFPAVFGLDSASDATDPYQATYSWTAPSAATGPKDVTAVNGAGLTASSSFTVTPDTAAPSVSISAPITGAAVKNGVTVDASAADALAGVAQVEFGYCGGLSCTSLLATPIGTDATAPYSVAWDAHPADGTYTLLARASDQVGNTAESAVTVIADNTPPTSALSLVEGARADLQRFDAGASTLYYNPAAAGDFRLVETASDALAGVQKVDFPAVTETGFSGPASSDLLAPYESSLYSFGPTNAVAPGPAAVVVSDLAGNSRADTISFVRDTLPPSGGSVSYVNGYDTSGSVIVTTANGSDAGAGVNAATALLERDAAPLANGSCAGFADAWTAVSSPDTTVASGNCYRYRYVVADHVGNSATYTSTNVVKVDTSTPTEPALSLAEAPASPSQHVDGTTLYYNPQGANSGSFTVAAATSDPDSAVSQVSFPGVFGADAAADTLAPYTHSYSWTATAATTGAQLVTTTNGAGLTASASFTVTPDTAGPSISFSSPAVGAAIRNGAAVSAAALDALAGTADVEFRYCPGSACAWSLGTPLGADSTAPYSVAWSMQPPDGTYTLVARALDNVGNSTEAAPVTVIVDNTVPVATQNDPGTPLENIVTLQATASDALSGIATVTFEVSPGGQGAWTTIGTDTTSPYSIGWDTLTVNDGRYDLRVLVGDRAGNSAGSAVVRNRQVTNHPPVVSITSPDGFYVNGSEPDPFTITAQSPSPNLRHVEFFRCSDASTSCATGTWISLGLDDTAPYTAAWTIDPDGNRALKALVTNQSFAEGTDVNNVLIDRSAPTGGSATYAAGYDADGSILLTLDPGTDAGSGVDASSGLTDRQTAPLANGACGPFGAWQSAPFNPDTVAHGSCARYRLHVFDEAGNEAVYESGNVVKVDLTPPAAPALTLTETEPDEHVAGTTLYYNPNLLNTGAFTVGATTSDPESGVARVSFPDVFLLDGGDVLSAPYARTYSWTSSDNALGAKTVSAHNGAGLSSSAAFTVSPDTTAPVTADDTASTGFGWQNAPVTVTLMPSDTGAGVAATHFTTDGSTPTTGSAAGSSVSLASDGTYTVRYFSVDHVGNVEPVVTAVEEIRVDVTSPAPPTLTLSESSAFAHVAGAEVFVNPGQVGTYTVAADASDATSGIEKIRFPGATDDGVAPYEAVFALGALSGAQAVTAFDNAGNTAGSGFTVTPDTAGPAGGHVSYPDGYDADGNLVVSTADGTDGQAGVETTSRVLERQTAALADDVCGAFGAWTAVASPDTIPEATCARYRYRVSDRIANETAYASTNLVKVDLTAPTATLTDPGANLSGAVTLASTATDSASGVASVVFQRSPAGAGDWTDVPATWDTTTAPDGFYDLRVVVTDRAGNVSASAPVTDRRVDNAIPTVFLAAPGPYLNATSPDPFTISATTSDGDVASIEMFRCSDASLDCATGTWISLGLSKAPPHSATWALDPDGNRALRADALDAAGNLASTIVNVTIDRDAPVAVKLTATLPLATPMSANTIGVTLTDLIDSGSGVSGFSYQWDNDPAGAPDAVRDAGAETTTLTSPTLPDGSWYLHVRTVDAAGNWGDTAHVGPFLIDATPPAAVVVGGADLSSPVRLGRSIRVAWSAAADAAAYDVRYRAAPLSGSFGDHVLWQAATTSTSGSFTGAPGTTYCFSARAYDALGNVTPWISDQCTALPLNNTSLAHRGAWAKRRSAGSYLGTHSATSTKGAKLIRTGVGAKQLTLVATKCRGCGTVGVYWNGVLLKKVSLGRPSTARKQVIPIATFASLRRGTVRIVVLSSGKPVLIEGLGAGAV